MKIKFLIVFIIILLNSCQEKKIKITIDKNNNKSDKNEIISNKNKELIKDYQKLRNLIDNFIPQNMDLSRDLNDTLEFYDVEYIFNNVNIIHKMHIIHMAIMKNYYYNFYLCNQGHNLLSMSKGKTSIIIKEYIKIYHLENYHEGMSNGLLHKTLRKNRKLYDNDKMVEVLIKKTDSLMRMRGYGQCLQ